MASNYIYVYIIFFSSFPLLFTLFPMEASLCQVKKIFKFYVGDNKSYVGDSSSYVGDNKSYVGVRIPT